MKERAAVLMTLLLSSCTCLQPSSRQEVVLPALVEALNSSDPSEYSTAAFLLGHLDLEPASSEQLESSYGHTSSPMKRLLIAYVLSSRLRGPQWHQTFIDLYPRGGAQTAIWDLPTHYASLTSPLQEHLAFLVSSNSKALHKLVSGLPFADGVHLSLLKQHIVDINKSSPEAVADALNSAGLDYSALAGAGE